MLDLSRDVVELCQEHGLGQEWIERSASPEGLLDRALEECARLSACHGRLSEASLLELRGLVLLALLGREMQRGPAAPASRAENMRGFFDELGALCHKINNPLTSLMGRAQMLGRKMKPEPDSPLTKDIQVIEESARRVAALVQELAHFASQARIDVLGTGRPR